MHYKTILVHVDLSIHAEARIRYAARLAQEERARLIGAALLGVPREVFPTGYTAAPSALSASYFEPRATQARQALARFEAIASAARVPHQARFLSDQADTGLAGLARFADLVVLSQDDPEEALPDLAVDMPDEVILRSPRPVLVLPSGGAPQAGRPRVLAAWDGSRAAASALGAALPLLRRAAEVTVAALLGPTLAAGAFAAQQDDLAAWLGQHGVSARVLARPGGEEAGTGLLALAAELHSDVLVMGCYGHSRLREWCLGGVTRTVLATARLPVLLAH